MADVVINFFGEDEGHELFFRAIVARLADEVGLSPVRIRSVSARGGHGRVVSELRAWLRACLSQPMDVLVVLVEANGAGMNRRKAEVPCSSTFTRW